ncbi:MAG: S8 family serine peptidase [Synechococcales cyanobacterium C42_A2020_086]|jgi:subtilisin family serine protease|nr:S8 family serine peptidase [Synechococcales cyanobacterium C42_A2020_086]
MVTVQYGGQTGPRYELTISDNHVVVRTNSRRAIMKDQPYEVAPVSLATRRLLDQFEQETRFREAGVEVLRAKQPQSDSRLRDTARTALKAEADVEFAGRVLVDPVAQRPVIYTENLFIQFSADCSPADCQQLLQGNGLTIKRPLDYARNAYFVAAPTGTGLAVFDLAQSLLQEPTVQLCHPELVRELSQRQAFPPQWHLKPTTINNQAIDAHAHVEAAWSLSTGSNIIIAIVDDGVDLDHEEFRSSSKLVAPRDVTRRTDDPRPGRGDDHGTACAGVACANGNFGASGVAPNARLLPIRYASGLGSQAEADAFVWAARNGADVISCSWGPPDGNWWDPTDPVHQQVVPLPDSTRLAIEFAISQGRNGKGCVICFAAGNGNESVDNDGYASYEKVIAVAACNEFSRRSVYSDYGQAVWCAFPSNDFSNTTIVPGIWTTDRSGTVGYNQGSERKGDQAGNYTNSFGGTSSACPGAAGVAALVLARNPELRWDEVRDILRRCCDKIDPETGQYDENGRSPFYGYGRLNARKAVELATPASPSSLLTYKATQNLPIRDFETVQLPLEVVATDPIQSIKVTVDLDHSYIGDLIVTLKPPSSLNLAPLLLHNRAGGSTSNLKRTYDAVSVPGLATCCGKVPQGTWILEVTDQGTRDTGILRSFTLEIEV